jgi:hypothetical protein
VSNIERPIIWRLWSNADGESSESFFADRAVAEREAMHLRNIYGHFASTRIAPVTIRRMECCR